MKIVGKKIYKYSSQETDKWKKETFQPLSDLKLKLKLNDGNLIECALFQMIMEGKRENHVCISTQAGCKYGCKFCSSGKNGFLRNLSREEMRDELLVLYQENGSKKLDCIVLMGIGEPLDNYREVVGFIKSLIKEKDLYNGARRIVLSTVGVPASLNRLAKERLLIDVWISLHASSDKKRKIIMPVAEKYSVSKIIKAGENYYNEVGRFVWLNYMLFLEFNNLEEDALKLAKLLKGKEKVFKLIITEPNSDIDNFKKASYSDLLSFEAKLRRHGVKNEIVRFITAGKNIGAGCGEFIFIPKN